ncbi:MAG: response regulator [Xenococcaceae cyanobacterium MO_188.B32]|nr:response regulator [Xenococcaceae cyanobacterium MO_188.B32]
MNNTLTNPLLIIDDKLKQAWSGCIEFTEPKDNSVGWLIYCSAGKVQYATSKIGQQERFQYLWKLFQIDLECPKLKATNLEYEQLRNWGSAINLVDSNWQELLLKFTKEAITQVLSLEQASVKLVENSCLNETIVDFSWDDLKISQLKQEAKVWTKIRTYLNSPFSRFHLKQDNTLKFYKFWKKLYINPDIFDVANSKKISFFVDLFAKKNSFYYIASQINIPPLKLIEYLKPCIEEHIFDILPWQNLEAEISPKVTAVQKTTFPRIDTYSPQVSKPTFNSDRASQLPVIACIDDSKTVQRKVKLTLEAIGYQVIDILDPALALKKLSRQNPVLILMDINMPTMNGYDLCRMLRRSQKFQEVPIVMLTGRDGIIDRMRAKFVGSTEYLTKPFEPNKLIELVKKLAV